MCGQNKKNKPKPLHLPKPQLYGHRGTEYGSIASSFRGNLKDLSSAADLENLVIILKTPCTRLVQPLLFHWNTRPSFKVKFKPEKKIIF